MLIDIIAAEQTDFIKIASVIDAIRKEQNKGSNIRYRLIYTGHYDDKNLSQRFFEQLNIPRPHINLETGKGISDVEQTAIVMMRYQKALSLGKPRLVLITGDSNATIACAITAKKTYQLAIAHIDSGLRNNDPTATNEINRVLTDSITDYYFTPSHSANANLRKMGVPDEKIFFVGNPRIDTMNKIRQLFDQPHFWSKIKLKAQNYILVCLHRSQNMKPLLLKEMLARIINSAQGMPLIFPTDMAGAKLLTAAGLKPPAVYATNLLEYPQFIFLLENAKLVVTDYTGIQEETTALHIPCITLGANKDLPETFIVGTNQLVSDADGMTTALEKLFSGNWKRGNIPYMWEGYAASRIMALLKNINTEKKLT